MERNTSPSVRELRTIGASSAALYFDERTFKLYAVRLTVILLAISGCGRIAFDPLADAADAALDSPPIDAPRTPITLIQDNSTLIFADATDPTIAFFPTPPVPGNFVWVSAVTFPGLITGASDNQGNTYAPAVAIADPLGAAIVGFYAANVMSSGGPFIVTIRGTRMRGAHVREYAGVARSSPLDQAVCVRGNSAVGDSGPITTLVDGELYLALQTHAITLSTSAGVGWLNHVITNEDNASSQAMSTEDRIEPGHGTFNGTFGFSSSDIWDVCIASFKPGS